MDQTPDKQITSYKMQILQQPCLESEKNLKGYPNFHQTFGCQIFFALTIQRRIAI